MRGKQFTRQNTLLGIPAEVDSLLRQKAARQKRSLSQAVVDELATVTVGASRRTDLADVTGRWVPDPAFDDILAAQRQIDSAKWK